VTFQNVETAPRTDYVGLGEGEYIQLLPGAKAREARDARLNHCNKIEQWDGPVFALCTTSYGTWNGSREPKYLGDSESILIATKDAWIEHAVWLDGVREELAEKEAKYAAKPESWIEGAIN